MISGIFPSLKTDKVLSLRWSLVENMGTKMGLKEMIQAKSVTGLREALKQMNFLMLNFTFGDVAGNIGFQQTPGIGQYAAHKPVLLDQFLLCFFM